MGLTKYGLDHARLRAAHPRLIYRSVTGFGIAVTKVHHEVVEHDGGWAYRVDGVSSEMLAIHDLARAAADGAARRQGLGGEDDAISYEDAKGCWHDEVARGDDRPEMDVEG